MYFFLIYFLTFLKIFSSIPKPFKGEKYFEEIIKSKIEKIQVIEFNKKNDLNYLNSKLKPGDVFVVEIDLKDHLDSFKIEKNEILNSTLVIEFLNKEIEPYFLKKVIQNDKIDLERSKVGALLGIDLAFFLAEMELSIIDKNQQNKKIYQRKIEILPNDFPKVALTVAPKMAEPSKESLVQIKKEQETLSKIWTKSLLSVDFKYSWPILTKVNSFFGTTRVFNNSKNSPHNGVDIKAKIGDPIRSALKGNVVYAGDLYFGGRTVILDHGRNIFTGYMHLDKILVQRNQMLKTGFLIGKAGRTGRVTGPHLHWLSRVVDQRVDPLKLIKAIKLYQ